MKNIIIKTVTPLSLSFILTMGSISMESQANEDRDLFLLDNYGDTLALNSGVRGKPPYNRQLKHNQRRRQKIQSVEMSALEINQSATQAVSSQITKRKGYTRGHPDRTKRHSIRY